MVESRLLVRHSTRERGRWRNFSAITFVLSSVLLLLSVFLVMELRPIAKELFVMELNNGSTFSSRLTCLKATLTTEENEKVVANDDDAEKDRILPAFEEEFPYRLTCPAKRFNTTETYQIIIGYHVGMVRNWKTIVHDQLRTLSICGWRDLPVAKFVLSYSNGSVEDVLDIFKHHYPDLPQPTVTVESTRVPWEAQAMNELSRQCQNVDKKTVVFYFHNKGASKYHPNWRSKLGQEWTYSNSLYWRKMMEYFTLERPHLCLNEIVHRNADACGVLWRSDRSDIVAPANHYSGNFWAASCHHIRSLPEIRIHDTTKKLQYVAAELWIGRKRTNKTFVSLKNSNIRLYRELIKPEMYWNGFDQ